MAVIVTRARLSAAAAIVLLAVLAGGCASGAPKKPPTGTPNPDKFLFDRGTENLNKHRWVVAREYFRQLVDTYPQSEYRADGKLGIGDTYIGEHSAESFVLGINEFREFLNFYPTNKRADYAQFKLAMCHYYQMRDPMRDQTETRDAIRELQTFLSHYPSSQASAFYDEAKQHLREAKDRLDKWDLDVGIQYYRFRWYPGAIGRLKPLIQNDPEYTNRDAAYFYLGESLMKLKQNAEALPYYERLVKEFERSDYLDEAKKRITELKATVPAAAGKGLVP
jgi:outer membrane protein assembly factor BamD